MILLAQRGNIELQDGRAVIDTRTLTHAGIDSCQACVDSLIIQCVFLKWETALAIYNTYTGSEAKAHGFVFYS